MKKLVIGTVLASSLLFGNSTSALSYLGSKHSAVFPTHAIQILDMKRSINLLKEIILEKQNLIFEFERFNNLNLNYEQINSSKIIK